MGIWCHDAVAFRGASACLSVLLRTIPQSYVQYCIDLARLGQCASAWLISLAIIQHLNVDRKLAYPSFLLLNVIIPL